MTLGLSPYKRNRDKHARTPITIEPPDHICQIHFLPDQEESVFNIVSLSCELRNLIFHHKIIESATIQRAPILALFAV